MTNLSTIVLAAGMGSRMKSSTPKVLHKVGNSPMINHLLLKAKQLNSNEIIAVISKDMESFSSKIQDAKISYQVERLGTAHAVLAAKDNLKNTSGVALVVYADTPLVDIAQLSKLVDLVSKKQAAVSVLAFNKEEDNGYGRLMTSGDIVTSIIEMKEISNKEELRSLKLCNSGVMAIDIQYLWELLESVDNNNSQKEYYLTDIIKIANSKNLICKFVLDEEENLLGINNKIELAKVESIFQNKMRNFFMENGVQLIDPQSVYFSLDTKIQRDVIVYPNVYFFNQVEVASGVSIYPNTVLEQCKIGENCNVGPFARLRPDTILQGNNNVGNFVEIKKSTIGKGSKVNHLSYIGDTQMGEKCNIGAGTVTCNYDGVNKYQTIIGDNCFIGSNSSLLAPIEIKSGATTAAGSIVTKTVPENSLYVSRLPIRILDNWQKPTKK